MPNEEIYTYIALSKYMYRRDIELDQALRIGGDDGIQDVSKLSAQNNIAVVASNGENIDVLKTDDEFYYSSRGFVAFTVTVY